MNGDGPHPPPVKVTIPPRINPLSVFTQIFPYGFSVFFVFAVTLACFPATTLQVINVNWYYIYLRAMLSF